MPQADYTNVNYDITCGEKLTFSESPLITDRLVGAPNNEQSVG